MSNTTLEYWAVDGVSLQTYAYNIVTWGGDRQAPPPLRGDNFTVPGEVGAVWAQKVPDQRTMTLAMFVQGADADGNAPTDRTRMQEFETNFYMLRKLLWNPYRQFALSKRIWTPDGYVVATAQAQYTGGLSPEMIGHGGLAGFTVDLLLTDPFFYGDAISAPTGSDFTVLGDARVHDITIDLSGNTTITNTTAGCGLHYTGSESGITIDVRKWTAKQGSSPGGYAGNVVRLGTDPDPHWMYLEPGVQHLTGTGTISYKPRYI